MKLSDKSFNYLFKAIASEDNKEEIIRKIFKNSVMSYFEGEFKLIFELYDELQKIANEFDSDYECNYPLENANVTALFHERFMYIRLAGDPEPYAEGKDIDVIGEWTIDLLTKEVEFEIDVAT